MSGGRPADAGTQLPTLGAYASSHGLSHRAPSMALPKATQLMRHGFMQEVRSLARGDLPGAPGAGWLAQVSYVYEGRNSLERSAYTLVLVEAAASQRFAIRVLCHDRGLDPRDAANADPGRQVVELDDAVVELESSRFLDRYALSIDRDQDPLRVWQIFDPSLIDWLSDGAPLGFSFELQDGALACFVPGTAADPAVLDALCDGAARVFSQVASIEATSASSAGASAASRASTVARELAAVNFEEPPQSTKAAAKRFRRGPFIGDRAWALGAEAFFRAHAAAAGFEPLELSAYRAENVATFVPGVPAHAARGELAGRPATLLLTDNEGYEDMGWSVLIAPVDSPLQAMIVTQSIPRGDAAARGSMMAGSDGRALILSTLDGGACDRKASELQAFLAACTELVGRIA